MLGDEDEDEADAAIEEKVQMAATSVEQLRLDEFDDEDQNLVVFRRPSDGDANANANGSQGGSESDDDDEEGNAAIVRVLGKYEKAKVMEDDKEGDFDARYELSIKEKMDEWKRGYYKVRILLLRVNMV